MSGKISQTTAIGDAMKMEGYVIVPPVSEWDDLETVWPLISYSSLGKTPTEAWMRHGRLTEWDSAKINRWIDRGYRLKKASLEIQDDDPTTR